MKKLLISVILAFSIIINTAYAADGCCFNPYADPVVRCNLVFQLDRLSCCPNPPSNVYGKPNGPTTQDDCNQNFWVASKDCIEVSECRKGCCYSPEVDCEDELTRAECIGRSGSVFNFVDGQCSSVQECIQGCCCTTPVSQSSLYSCSLLPTSPRFIPGTGLDCNAECGKIVPACAGEQLECNEIMDPCVCGSPGPQTTSSYKFCNGELRQIFKTQEECRRAGIAEEYTINGIVYEMLNSVKTPVANVLVEITGVTPSTTDSTGAFSIIKVPKSLTHTITASKVGYNTKTQTIAVSSDVSLYEMILEKSTAIVPQEVCDNLFDDDVDGKTDCSDEDCFIFAACAAKLCGNGFIDSGEQCDGNAPGSCIRGCDMSDFPDREKCVCNSYCGDGIKQLINDNGQIEMCDPIDFTDPNVQAGKCKDDCTLVSECGNDFRELDNDEECDGLDDAFCPGKCRDDCTCPIELKKCGDGNVEQPLGEQCDDDISDGSWGATCASGTCIAPGFPGQCTCTQVPECTMTTGRGSYTLEFPEQCDFNYAAGIGNDCIEGTCVGCACVVACREAAPVLRDVISRRGYKEFKLEWTSTCADYYMVHRCEAVNNVKINCKDLAPGEMMATTFTDNKIESSKTYCYKIKGVSQDAVGQKIDESNEVCVSSGDEICYQGLPDEFCAGNSRAKCLNNNSLQLINNCSLVSEQHLCIYSSAGNTKCEEQSPCGTCGTPFAMYPEDARLMSDALQRCSELATCYLDFSDTNVNTYYDCSEVQSCYDYRSKMACDGADGKGACGLFDCEWVDSVSFSGVGYGVCRPKNETMWNCGRCADPHNKLFGVCDREMCASYGMCYLNDADKGAGTCSGKEDIGCRDFDNEMDCIGDVYAGDFNASVDTENRNEFLQRSNDYFGYGTCKWEFITYENQGLCYKDANSDDRPDCPTGEPMCKTDNMPPVTVVTHLPSYSRKVNMQVFVDDNVYVSDFDTFFSIVPVGNYLRPNEKVEDNVLLKELEPNTGLYDVFYYSMDPAKNMEEVKNFTIFVDADMPEVRIEFSNTSAESGDDVWLTQLNISLKAKDEYSKVTCTAMLKLEGQEIQPSSSVVREVGENWTQQYFNLQDGLYAYSYNCTDNVGNSNTDILLVRIENDKSIFDLMPNGAVNRDSNIAISAKTTYDAVCKYDPDTTKYDEMRYSLSGSTTTHLGEYSKPGALNDLISLHVRCEQSGKVIGNRADMIRFGIDKTGPRVDVTKGGDNYSLETWKHEDVRFKLKCTDEEITDENGVHYEIGCRDIWYCSTTGPSCSPNVMYVGNETPEILVTQTNTISYFAYDIFGNKGQTYTKVVSIDKEKPEFVITIEYEGVNTSSVGLGRIYDVFINSSKNLLEIPIITFKGGSVNGMVTNVQAVPGIDRFYSGKMVVPDIIENRNIDVQAFFYITANAEHDWDIENQNDVIVKGGRFRIDSKIPAEPVYDPELNKVGNKVGDIYYFGKDRYPLWLSGYVKDDAKQVEFSKGDNPLLLEYAGTYQIVPAVKLATLELSDNSVKGTDVVYFPFNPATIPLQLKSGNFLKFTHVISSYPDAKEFYEILSVDYDSVLQRVNVKIDPKLDADVGGTYDKREQVEVYDKKRDSKRFRYRLMTFDEYGQPITGKYHFSAKALDDTGNPSPAKVIEAFFDLNVPKIDEIYPRDRWTVKNRRVAISINVSESDVEHQGSGIDNTATKLYLNGTAVPVEVKRISEEGAVDQYVIVHEPKIDLDGVYNAHLIVYDLARNKAEMNWTFKVDQNAPSEPIFVLPNSVEHRHRWFTQDNILKFWINFTDEEEVILESNHLDGIGLPGITVKQEGNMYELTLNSALTEENDYGLTIQAKKKYKDKDAYSELAMFHFDFSIDRTPPQFSIMMRHITHQGANHTIIANLTNDEHDINGSIYIEEIDRRFELPLPEDNAFKTGWNVPDPLAIGNYSLVFELRDYAGNLNLTRASIEIDNTAPEVRDITFRSQGKWVIKNGLLRTSNRFLVIEGRADSDVDMIYHWRGNEKYDNSSLNNGMFTIIVPLNFTSWGEKDQTIVLNLKDIAGNTRQQAKRVVVDLLPPEDPSIKI